jgi:Fe-S-cluster containining protein
LEDRPLIESGCIPLSLLYTIRRGEIVRDPFRGELHPVAEEIIKLKGRGNVWICVCFEEKDNRCRIYDDRPLECRALKCWDTREIERIYARRRLARRDLLAGVAGLWELVRDHEARCGFDAIGRLAAARHKAGGSEAVAKIEEIVRYDEHLRRLVIEKGGVDPAILDFLFGRPLAQTIAGFGSMGKEPLKSK